jgi:hypothetical protein
VIADTARHGQRSLIGQHASASAEWWSPPEIVDPARAVFGDFGLDPASCAEANVYIRARRIYTASDDGLRRGWDADAVWCNSPSKRGEESAARVEFRDRVRYLRAPVSLGLPSVDGAHAERGDAPPHGSAILLLTDNSVERRAFADAYAHLGDALLPYNPPHR